MRTATDTATATAPPRQSIGRGLGVLSLALLVAVLASLTIGAETPSPLRMLAAAVSGWDTDPEAWTLLVHYRIPRTLVAIAVGAALGGAGALMQGYTRNPLAAPGILGVNAGAGLAVIVAIGLGLTDTTAHLVWPALLGALLATFAVLLLAATGRGPATPVRMTLAGVALAAVLGGITTTIRLGDPVVFERFRSWAVGSVAGRDVTDLSAILPFVVIGLLVALALATPLNAIAMGEDVARSLGVEVRRARLGTVLAVALLVGAATAIAGPIGFVGLMVPHAVRLLVGNNHTRIVPLSLLAAPCLLLVTDTIARVLLPRQELPVGVVTAFVGAPVLLWLIRDKRVNTQ
ncbi:ABC-type Fe3+-siderophore transport system, permease component [Pseudonocardia sp. Ae168_Ps1]|uniref:FecCD family ABC transporter permease n=1 Tax=unclassified Pseudonocardia TaxID=2619320 RepID=UPI00095928E3|nr:MULTISPECIES: iron ABC transporter permease [unclassified Pseudonocardia]OLL73493.1 ABC-type Fe3+-siderophore transport system, permease component [Pseudonocardia sp. Ae150A_Ps1]OLL79471.1 ABC-type Fe3+-siderophore transport system, permease component [Pseudonocardia sp. Ae168_Ps1]OLL86395.1 ABC-type Fe3+-siderophore transport system, permease component [Pseudonocardia sp. Ae263_Ps1]OLL93564.1 ABC-type Fe3+-siderophore transport system, permease component [Pseudonocardia sp. Ae356_Ps1]